MDYLFENFEPRVIHKVKLKDINKYLVVTEDNKIHFIMFNVTGEVIIDLVDEDILKVIDFRYDTLEDMLLTYLNRYYKK